MAAQGVWPAETVRESREEPAPFGAASNAATGAAFARMMLSKSQNDKIAFTLDAVDCSGNWKIWRGMERAAASHAVRWRHRFVDHTDMSVRG